MRGMAMGKRKRARQPSMWVTTANLPTAASHPFCTRLNQLLHAHGFAPTSANLIADRSRGRIKKPNETRSTRIDGASAGIVVNASSADAGNCSSDRVRISTRPVGSGGRTCADARPY